MHAYYLLIFMRQTATRLKKIPSYASASYVLENYASSRIIERHPPDDPPKDFKGPW